MKANVRRITPEVAKEMLKRNTGNRGLSNSHLIFLSKEMTEGRWLFDGQPIRFTDGGKLLDGQHRLNAVINSGESQDFLIVTGIESDSFKVMDTGKNRNGSDCFKIQGIEYSTSVAATVKFIIDMKFNTVSGGVKISNSELMEWYSENKSILEFVRRSEHLAKAFSRVISSSKIAGYWFLFAEKNVTDSDIFINKLCNGLDLSVDSPIYVLRKKLIDIKLGDFEMNRKTKSALIIKAWNFYRKGESIKVLKWNKDIEKFPKIL